MARDHGARALGYLAVVLGDAFFLDSGVRRYRLDLGRYERRDQPLLSAPSSPCTMIRSIQPATRPWSGLGGDEAVRPSRGHASPSNGTGHSACQPPQQRSTSSRSLAVTHGLPGSGHHRRRCHPSLDVRHGSRAGLSNCGGLATPRQAANISYARIVARLATSGMDRSCTIMREGDAITCGRSRPLPLTRLFTVTPRC